MPVEPTEAMMDAGLYQSSADAEWSDVYSGWKDMLAAAPEPPVVHHEGPSSDAQTPLPVTGDAQNPKETGR